MTTDHYYDIINKVTGKTVFQNTNEACFAQFTNTSNLPSDKDHKMLIYVPYNKLDVKEDVVKLWLNYINRIGLPVSYELKQHERKADGYARHLNDKMYIVEVDFAKYNSKNHIKLSLHTLRWIFEGTMYKPLVKALEIKKPKESLFEVVQYCYLFDKPDSGHVYIYINKNSQTIKPHTVKDLKLFIEKCKDIPYDDYLINNFYTRNPVVPIPFNSFETKFDKNNYTQYKKILKQKMNGK